MEQKDYKKILRKIQLSANMFSNQNMFAGWVYSMIATELDENAHWNFIDTDLLTQYNKEIELELRRRRGDKTEDNNKEQPSSQLTSKIYPPSKAVMDKVSPKVKKALKTMYEPDDGPLTKKEIKAIQKVADKQMADMGIVKNRVAKELEGFSDAFKVRDKKAKAKKKTAKKKAKKTKK